MKRLHFFLAALTSLAAMACGSVTVEGIATGGGGTGQGGTGSGTGGSATGTGGGATGGEGGMGGEVLPGPPALVIAHDGEVTVLQDIMKNPTPTSLPHVFGSARHLARVQDDLVVDLVPVEPVADWVEICRYAGFAADPSQSPPPPACEGVSTSLEGGGYAGPLADDGQGGIVMAATPYDVSSNQLSGVYWSPSGAPSGPWARVAIPTGAIALTVDEAAQIAFVAVGGGGVRALHLDGGAITTGDIAGTDHTYAALQFYEGDLFALTPECPTTNCAGALRIWRGVEDGKLSTASFMQEWEVPPPIGTACSLDVQELGVLVGSCGNPGLGLDSTIHYFGGPKAPSSSVIQIPLVAPPLELEAVYADPGLDDAFVRIFARTQAAVRIYEDVMGTFVEKGSYAISNQVSDILLLR
ncbi:MAG: hypothetical protein KC731_40985 [Myxococcales bacterium]|nr:hypothetical protein [Myxococcales bacterium]